LDQHFVGKTLNQQFFRKIEPTIFLKKLVNIYFKSNIFLQKQSELTFVSIKIDSTFIFLFHRLPRYFQWSALATHDNGGIRRDTGDEGGTWWRATVLVQEGRRDEARI
jgi:hypothetical protein